MDSCKKNMFFISTYGFLMMFLSLQVSSSTDTASNFQYLSGVDTIVSTSGVFELGFFSRGTPNLYYLGIWYKQVNPQTIVWVANRAFPAPSMSGLILEILNGNFMLHDKKETYWSTDVYSVSGTPVKAVLLDNGNLVLRDGPNSSANVLWQSFDNLSDTWLPGAKIWVYNYIERGSKILTSWNTLEDPSPGVYSLEFDIDNQAIISLVMVWNGSKTYWSGGAWDDQLRIFKQVTDMRFNSGLSTRHNMTWSYITYSVRNQNPFRLVIDVSGQLRAYKWVEKYKMWDSPRSAPSQICKVYGLCGSFGICNEHSNSSCKCIPIPGRSFQESSGSNDHSSGRCVSETYLDECGKRSDGFVTLLNMNTDPPLEERVLTKAEPPLPTCESACLADCSCKAFAADWPRCFFWRNDILNLEQLDGTNYSEGRTIYVRLTPDYISPATLHKGKHSAISPATSNEGKPSAIMNSRNASRAKHRKVRNIVLAVLLPSVAAAAIFISLYCYFSSTQRSKRAQKDKKQSKELLEEGITDDGEQMFYLNLHDIMAATNSFSEENKLGEGGFGPVYKGNLPNGIDVAIKRLSKKSSQGLIEFKNEVVLIIKLQHKNLVRLLGYCVEGDEKLLIYEYMSNTSLDALLFDPLKCKELDWDKRMKIVIGTTKGLQYLHEDWRLKIIHRDIKASNILLDDEMNPKISDFGTARIFGCKQIDDNTERIVGTFGYMSPEYALRGMISEKSDIFSFGVLLLEIVSGKKATRFVHNDQKHSIIGYAWESWCETKGVSIIDEALGDSYTLKEVMRCVHIALLCVQDHPKDRPTISRIVYMLSNDHYDLPIPIQPTFTNVLNCNQRLVPSDYVFSINEATQSTMEGR